MTSVEFEECFRQHFPRLVALGETTAGDHEVARELAQETFVRLHENWATVNRYDNPGSWLWRVMSNLLVDHHRSRTSERRAVQLLAGRAKPPAPTVGYDGDEWSQLVADLPPRQRLIVTLYYGGDLPVDDIADALDISAGAVRSALSKARDALRTRWDIEHA